MVIDGDSAVLGGVADLVKEGGLPVEQTGRKNQPIIGNGCPPRFPPRLRGQFIRLMLCINARGADIDDGAYKG